GEKASTTLDVAVVRPNTAPSLSIFFADEALHDSGTCPSPEWCTAVGTPYISVGTRDRDGDAIIVDLEIVRRGDPFSGTPTYSQTVPAAKPSQQSPLFPLEGLTAGQSYDFAVRACDEFGSCASPAELSTVSGGQGIALANGWVTASTLGFEQGPCADEQHCACKPSGTWAMAKDDCCSGTIVWLPPSPTTPNGFPVCQ
ncbi:MAG: hypothetical protein ACJ78Y_20960, partial [Myxococcales bacterium]